MTYLYVYHENFAFQLIVTWSLRHNQTHWILGELYWAVYGAQYREFGRGSKHKYIYTCTRYWNLLMCKTKMIKTIKTHSFTSTFSHPCEASSSLFWLIYVSCISMLNFSKYGEKTDFRMKFAPKIYEWPILRKITHQNQNQHITICPCIKFQSIWRILDFGAKSVQKNDWQTFWKNKH